MTSFWGTCVAVVVLLSLAICTAKKEKTSQKLTRCWECMNYDLKGNFYNQCPMNDTVDPVRAYIGNCTGKCFTHSDDRNRDLVVRGCTSSQWGLPDPLPEDGCYPWYSEVWCVCSTDGCNGVKLGTPKSDKEFDAHIDYSKPQGLASSAHSLVISSLTAVLTAAILSRPFQWSA